MVSLIRLIISYVPNCYKCTRLYKSTRVTTGRVPPVDGLMPLFNGACYCNAIHTRGLSLRKYFRKYARAQSHGRTVCRECVLIYTCTRETLAFSPFAGCERPSRRAKTNLARAGDKNFHSRKRNPFARCLPDSDASNYRTMCRAIAIISPVLPERTKSSASEHPRD